jgi:hypothetical protein
VGGLDLRAEIELDLDDTAEALLLDRDRVQVVLAGLGGVADAQTGGLGAARSSAIWPPCSPQVASAGVVSPGRLPHRARSLASYSVSICNAVAASVWVFCS